MLTINDRIANEFLVDRHYLLPGLAEAVRRLIHCRRYQDAARVAWAEVRRRDYESWNI